MELVYKPQFQVIANDKDITAAIENSFSELTIVDVSGDKADTLTIKLDGSKISKLPTKKAALKVSLGFNNLLYPQGTFFVNSISEIGFPEVVTIKATSIPQDGKDNVRIQTQKTQSWDNISIAELLKIVASRNNLTSIVNQELGAIVIEHLDQTSESDMALINRLARQYGGVSKVAHENWLFLKVGEGKNASGTKTQPVHTIYKHSCSNYQYDSSSKTESSSAIAKWNNPETGENGVERAGEGEPAFEIIYPFPNKEEARKAAQAKAKNLTSGSDTFSVTPDVTHELVKAVAEGYIQAKGWRSEISKQQWCIKQITKKLVPSSGLGISISCESGDK